MRVVVPTVKVAVRVTCASPAPPAGRRTVADPPETEIAAASDCHATATPALVVGRVKSAVAVVGTVTPATARSRAWPA